ncbi:MAG: hypothetical protein JW709_03105 [Sedimentisphaerales bacterium]|nr:hypothetical protein [Sedimentisphaerales bacterium]
MATKRISLLSAGIIFGILAVGCVSTPRTDVPISDPLASATGADMQRTTEVQLVEQMGRYRTSYQRQLELLVEFYESQGNGLKAGWARQELEHLKAGPQRPYLVIAEIAGPELRATSAVLDADLLYNEGLQLMKEGRGSLGKIGVNKKKLYQAVDKFNELITNYPSSDKIDDAAFQVAEINHHYLADYPTALVYYQRVWQWDPQTPLPPRFQAAKIYDEQYHDRNQALNYYRLAINLESNYPENVETAKNRIEALSSEMMR